MVVFGIIVGSIFSIAALVYLVKKLAVGEKEESYDGFLQMDAGQDSTPILLELPLIQRIRNALFLTEKSLEQCIKKMDETWKYQYELTEKTGKISHILLKEKTFYLEITHPVKKESKYVYERDLNKALSSDKLVEIQSIVTAYQLQNFQIFEQYNFLLELHEKQKEQLIQIEGLEKERILEQELSMHKNRIQSLDIHRDMAFAAYKGTSEYEDIKTAFEHQMECLSIYQNLSSSESILNKEQIHELKNLLNKKG